ncbi:MAG: hemerythrin domain-containing protein [Myxococcales bacterium]|nr:hemerythrin domain-containing protein [Myxococcales bacterium]
MKDSIAAAHHKLDALLDETRSALQAGEEGRARASFAHLRAALEAHFDQEDSLYYPSIRALRPDLKKAVEGFLAAHAKFSARLAEIGASLDTDALADAERALEAFGTAFASHEASEERVLLALDRDLGVPR